MQEQLSIITDDIRISPNEYVVKYAVNRNFIKLLHNDAILSASNTIVIDQDKVQTYVPGHSYSTGDMVFYKTSKDSQSLYLLESLIDNNIHSPKVQINEMTGLMIVVSDEYWKIIGIPAGTDRNPKDIADEYVLSSTINFIANHEANRQLSAHPTGELGLSKSNYAFTSLDNLASDRTSFFYPNRLVSLYPNNAIQCGYMRQWDNGLLEYDIIFKLGSDDAIVDGQEIISANTLAVTHRNQNNFYFKDSADYDIFNQGDNYYVSVNKTKQVNLNTHVNAYSTELKFPEAFKDLNYMVFTSNMKNIETEAFNIKNEILTSDVDPRLIVNGLELVGHKDNAQWETPCNIPKKIVNIGSQALANTYSAGDYPIEIVIDPDSDILNIEKYAFSYSDISSLVIPKHVKHIGEGAFSSCPKLKILDIWLDENPSKQPQLDALVFSNSPLLKQINLRYYSSTLFAAANSTDDEHRQHQYSTNTSLYEKLTDSDLRALYQLNQDVEIVEHYSNLRMRPLLANAKQYSINDSNEHKQSIAHPDTQIIVKMFSNSLPPELDYLIINRNAIVGYDANKIKLLKVVDLTKLDERITKIAPNAFKDCTYITNIIISDRFVSIGDNAFDGCSRLANVIIKKNPRLSISPTAFKSCNVKRLEVNAIGQSISNFITLSSVDSVSLSALNFGANTLSVIDSDSCIDELTLDGPSEIQSFAFNDAKQISRVVIKPSLSGLVCNAHMFNPDKLTTSAGEQIDHQVQGLQLIGNKFKLLSNSFENIYANEINLDMTGSKIEKNTFIGSDIKSLHISNIYDSIVTCNGHGAASYELSGLGIQSLAMAKLGVLNFIDVDDMHTLSSMLINQNINGTDVNVSANVLSCPENCIIQTRDKDIRYHVINGRLIAVPSYLIINDRIVVSCDFDKLHGEDTINIPHGIVGIGPNAFNASSMPESRQNLLTSIYLPNSLTSLGDNCFSGNASLTSIIFAPNTKLEHLGKQIVNNCISLKDFNISI